MKTLPYGTWPSPVAAADLARSSVSLTYVRALDGVPYWLENRPAEGGRYVIVKPGANGGVTEVTPTGFNARTRVDEYGGISLRARSRGDLLQPLRRSAALCAEARRCARPADARVTDTRMAS